MNDPIQNANKLMLQKSPYNLEQIFTQICQYKVFLVNLKRSVILGDKNFLKTVCLINSVWFQKWKKLSCYEAIKDELNMCDDIPTNYKKNINNYIEIVNNLQITESLDVNIDNNSINRSFYGQEIEIDPDSNFDIISPELWDNFTSGPQNINNGTKIEIKIDYITKDSIEIKLGLKSAYIIFWNLNEQRLGKVIFKYRDEVHKFNIFEVVRNMGINNFYVCYLEDLIDIKSVKLQNTSFDCINKQEFKKNINNHSINSSNHGYNHHHSQNNYQNNQFNINDNYFNITLPMGLENVFLTCYMNASLQSFVNVEKLSNYFTSNNFDENNQVLSSAYSRVVINLMRLTPESQNMTYYSPKEFFEITKSISPIFQSLAGDANDLINFFLEQIHIEVNLNTQENIFVKYLINNGGNSMKINNLNMAINDYCQNNRSIITNTFFFIDKSKITCASCNQCTYNFQFQKTMIFPVEEARKYKSQQMNCEQNSINIIDGFRHYQRQIAMYNENMIYCNFCKMQTNAYQYNALYSAPEYLIINLNRGKGKIYNVHVDIQEYININEFVESKIDNNNYKLINVITHLGVPGTSGHYIAFCFVERENSWFKFNDANVEKSNFNEAINTGDSYVLFYKRV